MTFLMGLTFEHVSSIWGAAMLPDKNGGGWRVPPPRVCVSVCVCVREREERERNGGGWGVPPRVCQCSALRGEKRSAGPFI